MPAPRARYEQLYGESSFVQESGTHFTHACCDCGAAHNIKLEVLNEEEISVTYYKNQKATADFRAMPTHGILISEEFSLNLPVLLGLLDQRRNKDARRLLKRALRKERDFKQRYANGDFL
jgi:hypothetical protein